MSITRDTEKTTVGSTLRCKFIGILLGGEVWIERGMMATSQVTGSLLLYFVVYGTNSYRKYWRKRVKILEKVERYIVEKGGDLKFVGKYCKINFKTV